MQAIHRPFGSRRELRSMALINGGRVTWSWSVLITYSCEHVFEEIIWSLKQGNVDTLLCETIEDIALPIIGSSRTLRH